MEANTPLNPADDQFRFISDQTPLLIWASGTDKICCFFNTAWLTFTGRLIEQDYEDGWKDSVHPDDLQYCLSVYDKAFEARKEFTRTYRLKRNGGEFRHVTERATPRFRADGTFTGYAGYGIDMNELLEDAQIRRDLFAAEAWRKEQNLNEELASTNEELSAANEELTSINEELGQTQEDLASLNRELENIVAVRTKALMASEAAAQKLNKELAATNEELAAANEELVTINEELAESREELQRSEKLFRTIALNIPKSLVMVIGSNRRFMAIEGALMSKMGYENSNYIGKHLAEADPERYQTSKHLYDRVLAGEQFTVDRKGSDDEDFRMEFVPLRNEFHEVYAALIITLDITDIKQAEEKSAKLAAIVASSDDAIVSKTLNGIVTSWNASAERMFGYSESEMIGQPILKIIPLDRQEEEPRILERLRRGERVKHFETKRISKDNKILDVSLTISPVRDNEGRIVGISKIARDISERKRDEQRKNDFIGMVSHELKTPLTSVNILIQVLQAKLSNSNDTFVPGALNNAGKQIKKMTGMINGFLNLSSLESGKMPMVKQEFMLDELLKEAVSETELTMNDHHIRLSYTPVKVNADWDKIGSVILNLLSNAIKYSSKSSVIDVDCRITDGKALVTVKDQGIGIKAEDAKKLFDRYYRVENDHTRHISGFGIGLYLSAEIIRQHHGEIGVETEFGKGSTFYFTLPLSQS